MSEWLKLSICLKSDWLVCVHDMADIDIRNIWISSQFCCILVQEFVWL